MGMTRGVSHVGLSVQNVEEAKDFFVNILGFSLVKHAEGNHAFVSDGFHLLTLWKTADQDFDIKQAGLHHLALKVDTVNDLRAIESKLRENNYKIQFDGIGVRGQEGGYVALYFFGPSGIRIELASNEKDETGTVPIIGGCGVPN